MRRRVRERQKSAQKHRRKRTIDTRAMGMAIGVYEKLLEETETISSTGFYRGFRSGFGRGLKVGRVPDAGPSVVGLDFDGFMGSF